MPAAALRSCSSVFKMQIKGYSYIVQLILAILFLKSVAVQ